MGDGGWGLTAQQQAGWPPGLVKDAECPAPPKTAESEPLAWPVWAATCPGGCWLLLQGDDLCFLLRCLRLGKFDVFHNKEQTFLKEGRKGWGKGAEAEREREKEGRKEGSEGALKPKPSSLQREGGLGSATKHPSSVAPHPRPGPPSLSRCASRTREEGKEELTQPGFL